MKILSTLLLSAFSFQAYADDAPRPGTQITIGGEEAALVMKALTDAGVPTDNTKPDKLEVNVQSLACSVNLASTEVAACKIVQDAKTYVVKDEQGPGVMGVFTIHNAVHVNPDGSLNASAKTISCSSVVPANGTATCNITFETSAS